MTSRGTRPLSETSSSPTGSPARAAGDASVTTVTRGADIHPGYRGRCRHPAPGRPGPCHGAAGNLGGCPSSESLLAEPRGFCAGVEKAIKALAWMVRVFEPPVYCYHEIVHNRHVVDQFRAQGVVFVDDVAEVPAGAPLMLSAHGSAPEVVAPARAHGGVVVDAVCPLVTKVHHELKVRSRKGFTVLYVGHAGHEEAVGTMAVAPESVHLVEREERPRRASERSTATTPVALLAQTTLSHDEWRGLMEAARERFPDLWMPNRSDLCFATTNRQAALKAIADERRRRRGDRLGQLLEHRGPGEGGAGPRAARGWSGSTRPAELPDDLSGTVGVTAGASAPEALVARGHRAPGPDPRGRRRSPVTAEDEYFPPPPELRELLRALATTLGVLAGGSAPPGSDPVADDRDLSAADVLGGPGLVSGRMER